MEGTEIFNYNGNKITFQLGNGDVMVNATQMAKPFGKRPNDYLNLISTNELIKAVTIKNGIAKKQLIRTLKGGKSEQGTWMHEDIALDFAQWLNIDFKLWCNDRIKEVLRHGVTATPQKIEEMLSDPDNWIKTLQALKIERAEKERLLEQTNLQEKQLKIQAPKVEYFNNVLQSKSTYTTNQIAKELGMSARGLNKHLQDLRVQYKQNNTWLLYSKFQNKGYTKTKTYTYYDSEGEQKTSMQTVWTEPGRIFIHELLKDKEIAS